MQACGVSPKTVNYNARQLFRVQPANSWCPPTSGSQHWPTISVVAVSQGVAFLDRSFFSCESGHASFRASLGCAVGPRQVAVLELSGMHTGAAQKTTTTKRTNSNTMPLPHPTATNIHHSTGGGVAKAVNVRLQRGVRQEGGG